MLRYAMLAITMLPTCLFAQQATEDEVIAECVEQTEMAELLVKAFSQVEVQGETLKPRDIGQFIAYMEMSTNLEEKLLLPVNEENISSDDFYQLFLDLYEERHESRRRIQALAEAISDGPFKLAEAKTDMIVHCISAKKK